MHVLTCLLTGVGLLQPADRTVTGRQLYLQDRRCVLWMDSMLITVTVRLEFLLLLSFVALHNWLIVLFKGLALLTTLVRLNLSQNRLTSLDGSPLSQLSQLQRLNVDNNQITVLDGLHVSCLCLPFSYLR